MKRNKMVIDAHVHLSAIGLNNSKLTAKTLIDQMDTAGVDVALSMGSGGNPLEILRRNNDFNLQAALDYPERIIPFIYFDPRYEEDGLEEIDRCMKKGSEFFRGIKIGHKLSVAISMYKMMEKAQNYKLAVGIHCDSSIRGHPYIMAELANSFPKVNLIMLHMVGRTSSAAELQAIRAAEKNSNVWLETSYSWPYPVKRALKILGPDQIMYGSDSANSGGRWWPGKDYEREEYQMMIMMENVLSLKLPKEQEDKLMGLNAAKLFGLEVKK